MGPQSRATQGKVALDPLTTEACGVRGEAMRAQVEVGGEAQVTTKATPHSSIPRRVEAGDVRSKSVRVLVEALGGTPNKPLCHSHQVRTGEEWMWGVWR